jgi:hypothetical protein
MKEKASKYIIKGVILLEVALAAFIVAGVVIGSVDLFRYFKIIYTTPPLQTFSLLKTFLGHALLLVIGLELVIMLVRHTPASVIEVLLFATARKMIIEATTMVDILLGIISIGALFAINKFFSPGETLLEKGTIVSSATPIEEINKMIGAKIPEKLGYTLGGVITRLAQEKGKKPAVGQVYQIGDAEVSIYSMEGDLIKKLLIKNTNSGEDKEDDEK